MNPASLLPARFQSWTGKLVGGLAGWLLGGWLGALVGVFLGHMYDRARAVVRPVAEALSRLQETFFRTTFRVMGHLSKADGRVSEAEIRAAEQIMARMNLSPEQRRAAIGYFREGKSADFDLDAALDVLRGVIRFQPMLARFFLEVQLEVAFADGRIDPAERRLLLRIAERLGLSDEDLRGLESLLRGQRRTGAGARREGHDSLAAAYQTLGVSPDASDAEVKRAYRRLLSQHHPDKLASQGLPDEMMRLAKEKTQHIIAAYETIKEARRGRTQ